MTEKTTGLRWTLTFESGLRIVHPSTSKIVVGIENLQDNGPGDNWLILEATRPDGSLLGYVQTACVEPGIYIVELRKNKHDSEQVSGHWKAGRKEPLGNTLSQSREGLFKTYENEQLQTTDVLAIVDMFFRDQELHPNYSWRSQLDDLKAF